MSTISERHMSVLRAISGLVFAVLTGVSVSAGTEPQTATKDTSLPRLPFEMVPAYWPNPELSPPKWPESHPDAKPDPGMNRFQYWNKLCNLEAGDFILRTVENVEGVYLIRPVFVGDWRFDIASEMLLYRRFEIEDPFTAWTTLFLGYSKFPLFSGNYGFAELPVVDFERDLPNARILYSTCSHPSWPSGA